MHSFEEDMYWISIFESVFWMSITDAQDTTVAGGAGGPVTAVGVSASANW